MLYSRCKVWAQERNGGGELGLGWASAKSLFAQCHCSRHLLEKSISQRRPTSLGPHFPEAGVTLPSLRLTFSKTHMITLQLALVLGSWERLP